VVELSRIGFVCARVWVGVRYRDAAALMDVG